MDIGDVQRVTIDTPDDSIFVVSTVSKKMYHLTKSGIDLGTVNIEFAVAGIVYDLRTDTLWVIGGSTLKNINKDGTVNKTISVSSISVVEQIFLDENNDIIYATAGANYSGDNYVYKINLTSEISSSAYVLNDSYSVEVYINNGKMYICNDEYYYNATIKSNIIQVYDIYVNVSFKNLVNMVKFFLCNFVL